MTVNKLGEGHYVSADGQFEIVQYGEEYRVNRRERNRYVNVTTAKTLDAAKKEVNKLSKDADDVEPEPVEGEVVVETAPAIVAQVEHNVAGVEEESTKE